MTNKKILLVLNAKQLNYADLAKAIDVSLAHISNVVNRKTISKPVAQKIALAIDIPFEEVFPDYKAKEIAKNEKQKRIKALSIKINK